VFGCNADAVSLAGNQKGHPKLLTAKADIPGLLIHTLQLAVYGSPGTNYLVFLPAKMHPDCLTAFFPDLSGMRRSFCHKPLSGLIQKKQRSASAVDPDSEKIRR